MSPLFGNKQEEAAQEAEASAEFERLAALPVREFASAILPAWGSDGFTGPGAAASAPSKS